MELLTSVLIVTFGVLAADLVRSGIRAIAKGIKREAAK